MKPLPVRPIGVRAVVAVTLALGGCSASIQQDVDPNNDPTPREDASAGKDARKGPDARRDVGGRPDGEAPDAAAIPRGDAGPLGETPVPGRDGGAGPDGGPMQNAPAGPAGPWARGVKVGLVEITQGVFIKVGEGATVVAPGMRNAPVVEGRPLYARVHVVPEGGFTARGLRAVLSLSYGDGSKFEIEDKKMVSGPSAAERLDSTFNFLIPAAQVKPGATLVASVYEAGAAMGAEPATPPRFPATGAAELGIKAGRMELSVVIVPVGLMMDTPERRKKLEDDLYDIYPVQKVNLRIHAPVTMEGTYSTTKGFALLRELREKENAKPYEYYHLVIRATGVGYAGVASTSGPSANDGARRVGITIVRTNANIDGNTNTTAHEIGHNHGRSHSPGCGADGAAKDFPYTTPPGFMGAHGFSLVNMAFKNRMMWRDLMSYCRPRWISDFVYSRFEERVRIVTGYAAASSTGTGQALATRSLQGFAGPGETPDWGIVSGQLVEAGASLSSSRYALLRLVDGRQVRLPVAVDELSDEATRAFAVNLAGADFGDGDVLEAQVFIDGLRSTVPVNALLRWR